MREGRIREVLQSIEATGTYTHTFEELQHGAVTRWHQSCAGQ